MRGLWRWEGEEEVEASVVCGGEKCGSGEVNAQVVATRDFREGKWLVELSVCGWGDVTWALAGKGHP